jgi:hypothetical protein
MLISGLTLLSTGRAGKRLDFGARQCPISVNLIVTPHGFRAPLVKRVRSAAILGGELAIRARVARRTSRDRCDRRGHCALDLLLSQRCGNDALRTTSIRASPSWCRLGDHHLHRRDWERRCRRSIIDRGLRRLIQSADAPRGLPIGVRHYALAHGPPSSFAS